MNLRSLQHACRLLSWGCAALLAALSLLPAEEMVRTGLPSLYEHFIGYAGTAAIFVFGRGQGSSVLRAAGLLVAYAGLLEWLQYFSPGRHPALVDFFVSSFGTLAGALLGVLALSLARRVAEPSHSIDRRAVNYLARLSHLLLWLNRRRVKRRHLN